MAHNQDNKNYGNMDDTHDEKDMDWHGEMGGEAQRTPERSGGDMTDMPETPDATDTDADTFGDRDF